MIPRIETPEMQITHYPDLQTFPNALGKMCPSNGKCPVPRLQEIIAKNLNGTQLDLQTKCMLFLKLQKIPNIDILVWMDADTFVHSHYIHRI